MRRTPLLLSAALPLACLAAPALAQDLQDRPVDPAPVAAPTPEDEISFSTGTLEYDSEADIVTATGDVRLYRGKDRLRADKVVWNRKTGQVVAEGNIAVTNPNGDTAYGDRIELTDTLRDGVVDNMLVVLDEGGRIAAERGTRDDGGVIVVEHAAYTPCAVTDSDGCPKEPSWKITADKVVYNPETKRLRYTGARVSLFGIASIPLPKFSHPVGDRPDNGFLMPDLRYDRTNGLEFALPYFWALAPNRDLTLTPHIYTNVAPMIQGNYRELTSLGAYSVTGYATYSSRTSTLTNASSPEQSDFRGYLDAVGRFQLDPAWSASGSIRLTTDKTFLRRYDISRDDRLRSNLRLERIDRDSYFAVNGWFVQTLRVAEDQGLQPIALPEIDYRRRMADPLLGGRIQLQLNSLALTRYEGQDTQRAFASVQWDLRKITPWGQEVTFTAYGRGDLYNANGTAETTVPAYRGLEGFHARGVGALAIDVKWPLMGEFLGGTQRITPRFQIVAAPRIENIDVPNEDARAVDLEDSNLFALNRFPGYDRFEDSTRFTWGLDYALYLPGFSLESTIGQSYRLDSRPTIFPDGTGLTDRVSDIVGRTVVRYRDFVTFTHRYRVDKDSFAVRRNEIDATVGSQSTYLTLGYLRLNRNITPALEDLRDREEGRIGGRVAFARFWSVFGSAVVDLTDQEEDPLSSADGFSPVRHRLGVAYEDDCLRLGMTWKRDYQATGDAKKGDSFLLTLAFKNLGR